MRLLEDLCVTDSAAAGGPKTGAPEADEPGA